MVVFKRSALPEPIGKGSSNGYYPESSKVGKSQPRKRICFPTSSNPLKRLTFLRSFSLFLKDYTMVGKRLSYEVGKSYRTRRNKAGTTWERTGKSSGGEPRAPTALYPTLGQEPASRTLSTKLVGAGSWDIRSHEMRNEVGRADRIARLASEKRKRSLVSQKPSILP
jgi:hypothetical protein